MQEHLHFLYLVIVWALFAVFFDGLPPPPSFSVTTVTPTMIWLYKQGTSDNQRVGRHFQLGELEWDRKHGRPAWCASMLASIQIPPPSGHILYHNCPWATYWAGTFQQILVVLYKCFPAYSSLSSNSFWECCQLVSDGRTNFVQICIELSCSRSAESPNACSNS